MIVSTTSDIFTSSFNDRANFTFPQVILHITLDTLDWTVYYYSSLEHLIFIKILMVKMNYSFVSPCINLSTLQLALPLYVFITYLITVC